MSAAAAAHSPALVSVPLPSAYLSSVSHPRWTICGVPLVYVQSNPDQPDPDPEEEPTTDTTAVSTPKYIFNTNNHSSYRPFYQRSSTELLVDPQWWHSLSPFSRQYIQNAFTQANYTIIEHTESIPIPNQYPKHANLSALMYDQFCDICYYPIWFQYAIGREPEFPMFQTPILIPISASEKKRLKRIPRYLTRASPLHREHVEDLDSLAQKINRAIDTIKLKWEQEREQEQPTDPPSQFPGVFVRMGVGSGKHDEPLRPYHNATEILDHLTRCRRYYDFEYCNELNESTVILTRWTPFDRKWEFRWFICQGRLVASSQQHCFKRYEYTEDELSQLLIAMEQWGYGGQYHHYLQSIPYSDYIADVYYNIDTKQFQWFECNSSAIWSAGGSSLYDWIRDYDILYGKNEKSQLRIVV